MSARRVAARALFAVAIAGAGGGASACSVLLDWSGFSGGVGDDSGDGGVLPADAGDAADVGAEAAPGSCEGGVACVTAPPQGWTGPVELYVGSVGTTPPACGAGFDATPVFDGNADLTAPAPTCTACGCGAATGVTCTGPVMSFFLNSSCVGSVGSPLTVSSTCSGTTPFGAQSASLTGPSATGGTCGTTGGAPTATPPSWARVARACAPSAAPTSAGCGSGQVCATPPGGAFSKACVMQAGVVNSCPVEYPTLAGVFYTGVDDQRGCSPCQCTPPSGGSCTIATPSVNAYLTPGCGGPAAAQLNAPTACAAFNAPEPVMLAATPTVVSPGTCSLIGGGVPGGVATGTGPTSFCCAP